MTHDHDHPHEPVTTDGEPAVATRARTLEALLVEKGVVIMGVVEGSPAAKAELRPLKWSRGRMVRMRKSDAGIKVQVRRAG